MKTASHQSLSADRPVSDPKDDRLGYAPFSKQLALSIRKMLPDDGLVIAIYGPWGTGKTTVLSFVKHYLQQNPQSEQPIIAHFNPWWFSGQEDLTRRFFDQLRAVLSKWEGVAESFTKQLSDFADA